MKLLLDMHIFLWCISEPDRIAADQRRRIESLANTVYVSAISVAEIAIKASLGKLTVTFDPNEEIRAAGFEPLHFTGRDAARLQTLPFHHRDPFDRMLISQSLEAHIPIVTQDPAFRLYGCQLA
ncbi:MAG: type II toxin-antitoxin system VapC family toxin [Kiritimatiellia bacterium]